MTASYRGPLKAVILDWAGTTVDYGSFAPTAVFLRLFESRGVPISIAQARLPMGLPKLDHLRAICALPDVQQRWQVQHGHPPQEAEIQSMYQDFVPRQMACLAEHAALVPGMLDALAEFRRRGLKIGSTTGYTRQMMEALLPLAAAQGYTPDAWVCPGDVPAGRPYPWMCYQNAIQLQVYPLPALVKIGDTLVDIEEGLNAGMWTVGLALSGNLLGLPLEEVQNMSAAALQARRAEIQARLYAAGAHYVADSIAETPPILDAIQQRLENGERPD